MAVTIQQIAERAGVSRGTVDRALNHRGRINPEVAENICRLAEEMGYVQKERKRSRGAKDRSCHPACQIFLYAGSEQRD